MATLKNWLVVIPARMGSSRFPEKALVDLCGRPMIARVYDRTAGLRQLGARVIVATDHPKILEACRSLAIDASMTNASHPSGTDRCHEVATKIPCEFVMNVQGDEPFIESADLVALAEAISTRPFLGIATLAAPIPDEATLSDPNIVKVVTSSDDRALYFSRSPLPYIRDRDAAANIVSLAHVGIYAFRRGALDDFVRFPPSTLERIECLEQLRALENGMDILVHRIAKLSHNINTADDVALARKLLQSELPR